MIAKQIRRTGSCRESRLVPARLGRDPARDRARRSRTALPRRPALLRGRAGAGRVGARVRARRPAAALAYDEPEVQQVRRDVHAWWIPLLGDELVCVTTLAVDAVRYGGAVTAAAPAPRCSAAPAAAR